MEYFWDNSRSRQARVDYHYPVATERARYCKPSQHWLEPDDHSRYKVAGSNRPYKRPYQCSLRDEYFEDFQPTNASLRRPRTGLHDSRESRKASVDVFLKAAGYLECAVRHVLPQIPPEVRRDLPVDLAEETLQALSQQALGQGVEMQLGMAIDSTKATLAVKRRLACEMVKYWNQAHENLLHLPLRNGWGQKHQLFVKWKHIEAKAAAYYYHGLILDEGNTEQLHGMAVAALQAADEFLKESKRACEAFNTAPPTSRCPPMWGAMKYLSEKIPKDASSKVRINRDLYSQENRSVQRAPELPDFALALKPDDYHLPPVDPYWTTHEDGLSKSREQLKPERT